MVTFETRYCLEQLSIVDLQASLHTSLEGLVHYVTNAASLFLMEKAEHMADDHSLSANM